MCLLVPFGAVNKSVFFCVPESLNGFDMTLNPNSKPTDSDRHKVKVKAKVFFDGNKNTEKIGVGRKMFDNSVPRNLIKNGFLLLQLPCQRTNYTQYEFST